MRNNSGVVIMENREKIIQLLKNPLVTGYGIEIMSNGRLSFFSLNGINF